MQGRSQKYSWTVCLALALSLCAGVSAREVDARVHTCLAQAASKYRIPFALMLAVAETESGFKPHIVRKPYAAGNLDGSTDFGLMQINSWWLPVLAKYGIGKDQLFDACVNAEVGAWILAQNFQKMGYSWLAVGAYNAVSTEKRWIYATRVSRNLSKYAQRTAEIPQANASQIALTESGIKASTDQSLTTMGIWETTQ